MAESGEMSILDRCLEVALNPIGSLALGERLDASTPSLMQTFNVISPRIVDLILSPYGFRIAESFLNANAYVVNVRLAEHLGKEWSGLEQVLRSDKGRYVCDTLLKRKLKTFAHKIISVPPKDWWFTNVDSLPILIKAINMSSIEVAKEFISNEKMEIELCDYPEGLYCVLRVKGKSMDRPGWKDALSRLVVLKSQSDKGSDALEQAILYGDYLVNEIVEILCCRPASYDNSSTVSLIIRLIERGSIDLKRAIVKYLCEPAANPTICKIRSATRFEEFKKVCDANFTASQMKHLDDHLASAAPVVRSVVDETLMMMETNESDSMSTPDGQNKKRRRESPVPSTSATKKPREEAIGPQPSSSKTTEFKPSTVAPVSTVPPTVTVPASSTVAPVSTISPPVTETAKPTVIAPSTVSPAPTVATKPTVTTLRSAIPSSSTVVLPPAVTTSPIIFSTPTVTTSSVVHSPSTKPLPLNTPPSSTAFLSRTGLTLRLSSIPLPPTVLPPPTVSTQSTVAPEAIVTTEATVASAATVPLPLTVLPLPTVTAQPTVASAATVPSPSTVPPPTVTTQATVASGATVSHQPTVPTPTVTTQSTVATVATVPRQPSEPPPPTVTTQSTVASVATVPRQPSEPPPPTVTTLAIVASATTVPSTTPSTRPFAKRRPIVPRPVSPPKMEMEDRLELMRRQDPGKDVTCMAMGAKYRVLLTKLNKDPKLSLTIFISIRHALLSLMMDERGSEVVKWFITNGSLKQKRDIERKVEENMEDLVTNGGYGRTVVQFAIDNCADSVKKKDLSDKLAIAMVASRDSVSPTVASASDEIQIVSQKINKQPDERSTVAKVPNANAERWRQVLREENGVVRIMRGWSLSNKGRLSIIQWFKHIDFALQEGRTPTAYERKAFIACGMIKDDVSQLFIDEIRERMASQPRWLQWNALVENKVMRPYLVGPMASVLCLIDWPSKILDIMLTKGSREAFINACLEGNKHSPFVCLFKSGARTTHYMEIGKQIVRAMPDRIHAFLSSPLGRSIAESEKGRKFFESLAKPPPGGHGWVDLLEESPPAVKDEIGETSSKEKSREEQSSPEVKDETGEASTEEKSRKEQAITQPTVITPLVDTVASSSQSNTVAAPQQSAEESWDDVSRSIHQYINTIQSSAAAPSSFAPPLFSAQPSKIRFGPNGDTTNTADSSSQKQATTAAAKPTVVPYRVDTVASRQLDTVATKTTTTRSPSSWRAYCVQPSKIRFGSNIPSGSEKQAINKAHPTVSFLQMTPASTPVENMATRSAMSSSSSSIQPTQFTFGSNAFSGLSPPISMPSRPLLFQSPLINISSSGTPSFPIHRSPLKFSFGGPKPADKAVEDTE